MTWLTPIGRLFEDQRQVLKQCSDFIEQPKWIEGFAGSGKTVLLVHAIQNYLQKNPGNKVCIVVFTHALIDLVRSGISEEFSAKIPVMTYLSFVNNDKNQYDLVVVDEVQDVPETILTAIRKKTKNLLVGGDDAQSIYKTGSRAEKIESILHPQRLKLTMTHRLTKKIIKLVKNILPDSNMVANVSGQREEVQVTLAHANSSELELNWVWRESKRSTEIGRPSVVVFPNHDKIKYFMRFVAQKEGWTVPVFNNDLSKDRVYSAANKNLMKLSSGVCLQYLGNSYGSLEDSNIRPVVYVMTYHSIKGLDFRTVFLPFLNSDTTFWREEDTSGERWDIDRRLFFVGVTRSFRDLFMSYHGDKPHLYVQEMPQDELHKIEIDKGFENDDEDFIF